MPDLSAEQKNKVVFHLGYPAKTLIEGSIYYNYIMADRMNNLPQGTVDEVASILAKIEQSKKNLDDSQLKGNVTQVEQLGFDPTYNSTYMYKEFRRYVRELSSTLDIPIFKSSGSMMVTMMT